MVCNEPLLKTKKNIEDLRNVCLPFFRKHKKSICSIVLTGSLAEEKHVKTEFGTQTCYS